MYVFEGSHCISLLTVWHISKFTVEGSPQVLLTPGFLHGRMETKLYIYTILLLCTLKFVSSRNKKKCLRAASKWSSIKRPVSGKEWSSQTDNEDLLNRLYSPLNPSPPNANSRDEFSQPSPALQLPCIILSIIQRRPGNKVNT